MLKFGKKQIIVLMVVLAVILLGVVIWTIFQKSKLPAKKEIAPPEITIKEPFTFSAVVSGTNPENNFLMIRPISNPKREIKVIVSENTKLIKLEFPIGLEKFPKETEFILKENKITIKDFKEGDRVFIKTDKDMAEKPEIDIVEFIQIMP